MCCLYDKNNLLFMPDKHADESYKEKELNKWETKVPSVASVIWSFRRKQLLVCGIDRDQSICVSNSDKYREWNLRELHKLMDVLYILFWIIITKVYIVVKVMKHICFLHWFHNVLLGTGDNGLVRSSS